MPRSGRGVRSYPESVAGGSSKIGQAWWSSGLGVRVLVLKYSSSAQKGKMKALGEYTQFLKKKMTLKKSRI